MLAFPMAIGALLPFVLGEQPPTVNPCAIAEKQLAAGYQKEAEATLLLAIQEPANFKCATEQLSSLRDARCATAKGRLGSGDLKGAAALYEKILETDPQAACALDGKKALEQAAIQSGEACAQAHALAKLGLNDKARDAYLQVLTTNGHETCASEGLKALAASSPPPAWPWPWANRAMAWFSKMNPLLVSVITQVAPWIAIAGIIFLILVRLVYAGRLKLHVGSITAGNATLQETTRTMLASTLEGKVIELQNAHEHHHAFKFVDSIAAVPTLPELSMLPKEATSLYAFVIQLIPTHVLELGATAGVQADGAAVLNLRMVDQLKQLSDSKTLLESEASHESWKPGPKADEAALSTSLERLLPLTATWAYWSVHRRAHRGRPCAELRLQCRGLHRAFGTDNWTSHMAVSESVLLLQDQRHDDAERALIRALAADPSNRYAHFRLGRARQVHSELEKKYDSPSVDQALASFGKVIEQSQDLSKKSLRHPTKWIDPLIAAAHFYAGEVRLHRGRGQQDYLDACNDFAAAMRALEEAGQKGKERWNAACEAYAVALRLAGKEKEAEVAIAPARSRDADPIALYNVACYDVATASPRQQDFDDAVRAIREAVRLMPKLRDRYAVDPSLQPVRDYAAKQNIDI